MIRNSSRNIFIKSLLLFVLCMLSVSADASEKKMRRIVVGLNLFPSVVAADHLVEEKKDDKGYLPLYILHEDNPDLAQDLARQLRQTKQINNIPVKVAVLTFDEFVKGKAPPGVAAFLAQSPNSRTSEIVDLAISSSILLFSPFKGDVEKGVHSGIIVSDRILPYVNINTMQLSGIKLKAFFLRVSKHYD